jgi:hypothetical protein
MMMVCSDDDDDDDNDGDDDDVHSYQLRNILKWKQSNSVPKQEYPPLL